MSRKRGWKRWKWKEERLVSQSAPCIYRAQKGKWHKIEVIDYLAPDWAESQTYLLTFSGAWNVQTIIVSYLPVSLCHNGSISLYKIKEKM